MLKKTTSYNHPIAQIRTTLLSLLLLILKLVVSAITVNLVQYLSVPIFILTLAPLLIPLIVLTYKLQLPTPHDSTAPSQWRAVALTLVTALPIILA